MKIADPINANPVERVHLIAKTHLDLGFTALASEVLDRYVSDFFPAAMAVSTELREARGQEQLVWTTGSWLVWQALECASTQERRRLERAIVDGDLCWHALPFTMHTELADVELIESALGISAALDARFDRQTIAAKMTDVPGHTRGLVPLLAAAGVRFLHIGVNPACPMPDVPPVFRWRSPEGAEVVVAYHGGGYGGFQSVAGCSDALAFLPAGDNLGPPTIDEVKHGFTAVGAFAPDAEVIASTMDAFARALLDSRAVDVLPVVTAEIGDTWIHGAGSDPQKLAHYRALLAERRSVFSARGSKDATAVDRALLPVPEHTWGLDEKITLHDSERWTGRRLAELRQEPDTRRFEASWAEQRTYVDQAEQTLMHTLEPRAQEAVRDALQATVASRPAMTGGKPSGFEPWPAGEELRSSGWSLGVDPATGAVNRLLQHRTGRELADAEHPLALLRYQTFSTEDYDRFHATYNCASAEDEWWAVLDYTKPGIEDAGAVSAWWPASAVNQWLRRGSDRDTVLVRSTFHGAASEQFGAPAEMWIGIALDHDGRRVDIDVSWFSKPACRLPEATWCSFVPIVAEPERWLLDKLGQDISPLDVVSCGGRALHAVGRGARYDGGDGPLRLTIVDAALVAPGRPALLEFTDALPDMSGGLHVVLHDNVWATNFPMWSEGDARFRFVLDVERS
jgi:hypothetical protein